MGEGEDEKTIAAHLQYQSQLFIDKQEKVVVKRLLDLTYSKYRKLLVTNYKISTILELYSTLHTEQEVSEKPFYLYLHR